jgi:type III restriction enzyme
VIFRASDMELKGYQQKVIQNLESYLLYLKIHGNPADAFDHYWADQFGPYDPATGLGMQPYKNTVDGVPHICVKVPTAGGKTFIACNAIKSVFNLRLTDKPKMVVWLVPWSNILDQTVANLSNPDHPYRRKLDSLFNHRVEVYQKSDLLQGSNFNPSIVQEQLSIIVMNFASLRAKNKDDRKVYQENENLAAFASQYSGDLHLHDDADETALINVIRNHNPLLVVDESHNAESPLSVEMLNDLNPSFVIDLTATPKNNSNIISFVEAIELKKENMVKLPVIVYNHQDKTEVINSALNLQRKLELQAIEELKNGGQYIRPIVLFQAQPRRGEETTTFIKIKEQLLRLGIPAEQIKIKTANIDELKSIDLMSDLCAVRYIITVNALKEGWDCPFAYILASLADKSSPTDVEQILGRVLRQPYVRKHNAAQLNNSYVFIASDKFNEALKSLVDGLKASGFSEKDYRAGEDTTEPEKKELHHQSPATPESADSFAGIDAARIPFSQDLSVSFESPIIAQIGKMTDQVNQEMDLLIEEHNKRPANENIPPEMSTKVRRYDMAEAHKMLAEKIQLPQFFIEVKPLQFTIDAHDTSFSKQPLNQSSLLGGFKLSEQDTKIDFDQVQAEIFQIDLEETTTNKFDARYRKMELTDPLVSYILARPHEKQVKEIGYQLMHEIGKKADPIEEREIRSYIERILGNLDPKQLQDVLVRKWHYATRINNKIWQHADTYAETRFYDFLKIGKIFLQPVWKFPKKIIPGITGPPISNSLYEREGSMNAWEAQVITSVASLPNIAFWHRNLGKGKGFAINGFTSNHYPDFIVVTKTGNVVLIETKGDDRDNSDSAAKCRLGTRWEQLSGKGYSYFMIFDKKEIDGAHTVDKALDLIHQL